MSKVVIEDLTSIDVEEVVGRSEYKEQDRDSAIFTMNYCLRNSSDCLVGRYEGKIAVIWGLIPPSLLSDRAYIWFLVTDTVEDIHAHKFLMARYSRLFIERALEKYPTIVGCCKTNRPSAMRWLKWLGAEFQPAPIKDNWYFEIKRK
jgi:hypothetical protein